MSEVITIQQTAKKYKLAQTIGVLLMISGIVGTFFFAMYTGVAFLLGAIVYASASLLAWWNHG